MRTSIFSGQYVGFSAHCSLAWSRCYLEQVRKDSHWEKKKTSGSSCESGKARLHTTPRRNNNCGCHIRNNEVYPKKFRLKDDLGDVSRFRGMAAIPKLLKPTKINPYEEWFFHSSPYKDDGRKWTLLWLRLRSRTRGAEAGPDTGPGCRGPAHSCTMNTTPVSPSIMLHMEFQAHLRGLPGGDAVAFFPWPQEGALRTPNGFCYQRCSSRLLLPWMHFVLTSKLT